MSESQESSSPNAELPGQPFFYEIRVKGRLSQEKWTAWFDDLSISSEKGETVLWGSLPDHAALYGLIARLRDLAVPLLSVNVLDAEAQRRLREQNRRYNLQIKLLLILVYLLFLGGLIAFTVFITSVIHVALALAMLFAVLGGLAYVFFLWSGQKAWRYGAYLLWPVSVFSLFIYAAVTGLAHPALVIATLLVLAAGGLIYLVYYLRGRSEAIHGALVEWESLGPAPETGETADLAAHDGPDSADD